MINEREAAWLERSRQLLSEPREPDFDYFFLFNRLVHHEEASSWDEFIAWCNRLNGLSGNWAFRGQSKAEWPLQPSLDRATTVTSVNQRFMANYRRYEENLLFRFQQQAHRYVAHPPEKEDVLSWLALMQHHGVPTRLLDWTKSAYIAAYFAFDAATEEAAIWAVDLDWLDQQCGLLLYMNGRVEIPSDLTARSQYVNELLGLTPYKQRREEKAAAPVPPMIVQVEPSKTDAWMSGQMGFFLCKTDYRKLFDNLLANMIKDSRPSAELPPIRKLKIGGVLRGLFLKELQRFNISRATLFPDLDGFSRSLNIEVQIAVDEEYQVFMDDQRTHARTLLEKLKGTPEEQGPVEATDDPAR